MLPSSILIELVFLADLDQDMSNSRTCKDVSLILALEAGAYNIPQSSRVKCVAALKDARSYAAFGDDVKASHIRESILYTCAACGCIEVVHQLLAAGVSADPYQNPAFQGTFPPI